MAFLDNSGDIILDAVLTDEGRRRLARADGSFKITKFALGDDEIDYSSFQINHASGMILQKQLACWMGFLPNQVSLSYI